jgi:alpha-beta hydrolase superfamily lysophospholipase
MTEASAIEPQAFDIPCRDGLSIRGEVYPAESSLGSVIICHGFKGFAHWAFFPYLARTLAQDGLTAITFDFSGSGIGPDRESFTQHAAFANNTLSRDLEDLELIEDYARRKNWIKGKFGLFGHSRGGGTAILFTAAAESNVNSLVTW